MSYPNGKIPDNKLHQTVVGGRLVAPAQRAADSLALAFASKFYRSLAATDTYRSYDQQVAVRNAKGKWAAIPGTSVHGLGRAMDLGSNINRDDSPEHQWMEKNARRHGWINPDWATNSNPADGQYEPWHWEYVGRAWVRHTINRPGLNSIGIGDTGTDVEELQKNLNRVYAKRGIKLVVDGRFGMATYALLRRFQRARGMVRNTGVHGKWSVILMNRAIRKIEGKK